MKLSYVVSCLMSVLMVPATCRGQVQFPQDKGLNVTDCEAHQNQMITQLKGQLQDMQLWLMEVERSIGHLVEAQAWEANILELLQSNEERLNSLYPEVTSDEVGKSRRAACVPYSERVRLVNGQTADEGRVEVWVGSTWSPLAENLYRKKEADVICTALGYNGLNAAPTSYVIFGESVDTGSVLSPINCQHSAGVICNPLAEDVRLAGGQNRFEGRVEIRVNGQWGAVCDDVWEANDAKVVCNSLGLGLNGAAAVGSSLYGKSTGPVFLRGLRCAGTESHLLSCLADRIVGAASDCSASAEAGVICGDFLPYPVRLVGGSSQLEGRVEIRAFNEWGTVNRNGFDNADASVICRMLGYNPQGATAVRDLRFGEGTGRVWLADLRCTGNEDHVLQCYSSVALGKGNYQHTEDAGVICRLWHVDIVQCISVSQLSTLLAKSSQRKGICLSSVCLQRKMKSSLIFLGFLATIIIPCFVVGSAAGEEKPCNVEKAKKIHDLQKAVSAKLASLRAAMRKLEEMRSSRNWQNQVTGILQRSRSLLHNISVHTSKDTKRVLVPRQEPCPEERMRLVGGKNEREGRLELLTNGQWRSVCEDGWTHQDAKLVCTILGYPGDAVGAVGRDVFGVGTDSDACAANPAGVICGGFESYPVRLVNGSHANEGRVEIQINGEWGTVCQSAWDANDASVVCRMMGYTGRPVPVAQALFGEGSGQVWVRDLGCVGTESNLLHCSASYPAGFRSKCAHNTDVGVICPNFHYYPIRLQNGSTFAEGRVEIHMFNQWATINSLNWDDKDAAVICRMLGYSSQGAKAVSNGHFGEGSDGAPLLSDMNCSGDEEHILQCSSSRVIGVYSFPHSQDAGVICQQCMTNRMTQGDEYTKGVLIVQVFRHSDGDAIVKIKRVSSNPPWPRYAYLHVQNKKKL